VALLQIGSLFFESINDPNHYPGEKSSVSTIVPGLHPNNVITLDMNERALVSGLIKYRAGNHTDTIGIHEVNSPFHVPWVWNEFVLSYADGQYKLHLAATTFPTTYWYLNNNLVWKMGQVVDRSIPRRAPLSPISVEKMLIYPVLSAGAPAQAVQSPLEMENGLVGPVDKHPYTVAGYNKATVEVRKAQIGPAYSCEDIEQSRPSDSPYRLP
jgi:hypothetical protein